MQGVCNEFPFVCNLRKNLYNSVRSLQCVQLMESRTISYDRIKEKTLTCNHSYALDKYSLSLGDTRVGVRTCLGICPVELLCDKNHHVDYKYWCHGIYDPKIPQSDKVPSRM